MYTNLNNILSERVKILPEELAKYIASEELSRKMSLVFRKYRFDEEISSSVEHIVLFVLMALESVDNLHVLFEEIGLSPEVAANLSLDVTDYLLKPVIEYLAVTNDELVVEQEEVIAVPTPIIQPAHTFVSTPNVIGADKLRPIVSPRHPHIENPPRRITDTSHLIDDTIEERPKLQDHYND